jgi:hypothetical protein
VPVDELVARYRMLPLSLALALLLSRGICQMHMARLTSSSQKLYDCSHDFPRPARARAHLGRRKAQSSVN